MRISIIAAIDEKRGLGKNNQLLFKIPEDFRRMKALTTGHPIVMGRKTYESIGRPLPNRTNIVITRDKNYKAEGCVVVGSLEEVLRQAQGKLGSDEIFIFGGGEIFKQALPVVDRLYLTKVKGDFHADTFFPEYETEFLKVIEKKEHNDSGYRYTFLTLDR